MTERTPVPLSTPQQETPHRRLSQLERVFNFEDLAFREYMALHNKTKSPSKLLELSSEMLKNPHPLSHYAAGWAIAEIALKRSKPSNRQSESIAFRNRLEALQIASAIWSRASTELQNTRKTTELSPKEKADLWAFEIRSLQSLAYLPSMKIAASLFSGKEVDATEKSRLIKQTKQRVIELGATIVEEEDEGIRQQRSGICSEITSALLLQKDMRYLIIPSSIRQDHKIHAAYRSDLIAVSPEPNYPRTLIQVSATADEKNFDELRFIINTWEDLSLPGRQHPTETLRSLVKKEQGVLNEQTASDLDVLSRVLVGRLDNFNRCRELKKFD